MKKNILIKTVMTAFLVSSSVAMAVEYPASDFQPKVLYSDSSAQSQAPSAQSAAAAVVETDPNYPAANFQPKVVFNDAEYKHSSAAPAPSSGSYKPAVEKSTEAAPAVQNEQPSSSNNNLLGLLALAAVGFFLYSRKDSCKHSGSSAAIASGESGSTGVEKYLEKQGINKTGVAKYLEKQTVNPATGVAKYMAKQIVRDREAAAHKATGVEKYMRKNG